MATRRVLVEEALAKSESWPYGVVVPRPTLPLFPTTKVVPEEEPMAKEGLAPLVLIGLTLSCAHGEEEPTPRKPAEVIVVVPL